MGRTGNGVEVRESSIRIKFVYEGETVRERLTLNGKALPPTPANVKYAVRIAADIQRRIASGSFDFAEFFPESKRITAAKATTFGDLADLWLQSQGRLAVATRDQYAVAVRFWKQLIGEQRLVKDMTHKYLAALIGGHSWPSAKTHNNYLIALRGILGMEYRGATAMQNPLGGIGNMQLIKKLPDPLSSSERDRILTDMAKHYDPRVGAYFQFAFFTGMRPEEMIALRWGDVDTLSGTVRIQRVRTFKGSERDGSKTHTERDVDLVPPAIDALHTMKAYTFMKGPDADIFENPNTGRPWHDERSQRDVFWRPTLKRLGIRWRRAYSTRHTFATSALMGGVNPAYIAAQLGHSTKMLLDKYARWLPQNDAGSARALLAQVMGSSPKFAPSELNRNISDCSSSIKLVGDIGLEPKKAGGEG